ncbi:MAG: lysine--tRNA ligase [Promethearchaeota archaeon]|nr:MAG: lysine--tRNA ligase [Candidatus Lokiarchaeota archaeon]
MILEKNHHIHWLEEILEKIENRNQDIITLATGKTPSGHIHVGILREIIICDALRRKLQEKGKNVRFFLFIDSLDAAKRFPDYIDQEFQDKHIGKPFNLIPCPFDDCNCESYAHHFGNELISTFEDFGIKNEIIWTHELYKTKEMKKRIKIALKNVDKIKEILKKYILPTLDDEKKIQFLEMQKKWMPVMAICRKCKKIQTRKKDGSIIPNRIDTYNDEDETIRYKCPVCGNEETVSIYEGDLKLNWRIDWPAKWDIYKTTCEPAGKDHCVKGGSYDTGLEICQKIYNYKGPIKVSYEWLRLGERDMKTSKGIVFTPKKYLEIADPEIFRMLILRTNPMKHISFRIEEFPQYYTYFEKMENIFYSIEKPDSKEEGKFFNYLYPLVNTDEVSEKKPIRIPLNLLIFLSQIQNILSLDKLYNKAKEEIGNTNFEESISKSDFEYILIRTNNWIDEIKKIIEETKDPKVKRNIQRKITIFSIPEKVNKDLKQELTLNQRHGIKLLRSFLIKNKNLTADKIQNKIFKIAKEELKISPKKMFQAVYKIILGKKFGPRLGPFLKILDDEWLLNRLDI